MYASRDATSGALGLTTGATRALRSLLVVIDCANFRVGYSGKQLYSRGTTNEHPAAALCLVAKS